MDHSDCCKEKLSKNLQPRQSKPFIDKNLQLQFPESDLPSGQISRSHSPIYSHYMGDSPSISYLAPHVNESELYKAMKDAEHGYEAWKKMKEQLSEATKSFKE